MKNLFREGKPWTQADHRIIAPTSAMAAKGGALCRSVCVRADAPAADPAVDRIVAAFGTVDPPPTLRRGLQWPIVERADYADVKPR